MSACAEPYGVSRSAGASRRCRPWYSAASESRRPGASASVRSSQARQRRKRLRHGDATTPNLRSHSWGSRGRRSRAARPGAFEQRTEEHHLYHVNLSEISLLSRVKIRFGGKRL